MSIIKTSSLLLSAAAVAILASGAASAMTARKTPHSPAQPTKTHAVRNPVVDFSTPKGPLDAKAYFDRMRHDGY